LGHVWIMLDAATKDSMKIAKDGIRIQEQKYEVENSVNATNKCIHYSRIITRGKIPGFQD